MKIISNVLVLLVSCLLGLLLGEAAIRFAAPQLLYRFPQGMFVPAPHRDYKLAPNFTGVSKTADFKTTIVTNSLGLREGRELGRKSDDTFRILSIGDSFAMAVGVDADDSYARLLERALKDSISGRRVEVVNAGVPGYNTRQEGAYLVDEGLALQPDLLLLQFYVGNDIIDNHWEPRVKAIDGYLASGAAPAGTLPPQVRSFLERNSQLYAFVWPLVRTMRDPGYRAERQRLAERFLSVYKTDETDDLKKMWATTRAQLGAMSAIAKERGIPLAVVVIPDPIQVDAEKWSRTLRGTGGVSGDLDRAKPSRRIAEFCADLGVPVVDLLPVFEKASPGEPTYLHLDGHWTRRGNAIAADAMRDLLVRAHLLEGATRTAGAVGGGERK